MEMFAQNLGVKVIRVNAEERFLDSAQGRERPGGQAQDHRPAFIEVFDEESHKLEDVEFLAQGTIYPDVIESAGAQDRQGACHQEPSQRGRPAGAHEAEAGRAAARAVQG